MGKQQTFAGLAWSSKGKVTRRERFLREMDAVLPWAELLALIAPHYPQAGRSRRPVGVETMLRIYFLQQWFDLSDPAAEDAIYDSESMRRFVGVELGEDRVPDETTILRFRHLLERHQLTEAMFALVRRLLEAKGLLLKAGTIVDATILGAPSSTKNATGTRDPEMKQTRKGNQWYFGMKVHVAERLANYDLRPGDLVMTRKGTIGNCGPEFTLDGVAAGETSTIQPVVDHIWSLKSIIGRQGGGLCLNRRSIC